jgi:CMP-2-keto-3-deoxyoctulosonic acid synthetase
VNDSGISVDTPEDLERAEKYALQFSGNQKG